MTTATIVGLTGLALFVATTMMWFTRASQVAIPDNRAVFLAGWSLAALLGLVSVTNMGANWLSYIFGGLAIFGGGGLLALYALKNQKAGNAIIVGDTAPTFEALDDQGQTYTSDALMGTPTLIKFFRGHW